MIEMSLHLCFVIAYRSELRSVQCRPRRGRRRGRRVADAATDVAVDVAADYECLNAFLV